jgi:hypothetical protein
MEATETIPYLVPLPVQAVAAAVAAQVRQTPTDQMAVPVAAVLWAVALLVQQD